MGLAAAQAPPCGQPLTRRGTPRSRGQRSSHDQFADTRVPAHAVGRDPSAGAGTDLFGHPIEHRLQKMGGVA